MSEQDELEAEILNVLNAKGICATYVVKNFLVYQGIYLKTRQVLKILKRLQENGLVENVNSQSNNYHWVLVR